ncbi:hypothetical protein BU24DRAFT_255744 [Aaosphaeria arxii CBS 175.79]|uniref:Secreted protein n=1 Tax=Aaosphaeria arxii CBS 175.79 TaxID=1450172 RepID=A0A6A5XH85_9PLEO|nr:uncharacterized protein BU24DRAFT_255744 [Aaosphaeria arxii CBS 175.79]KAF2012615.1 hypothetical protein BU24DRAFT_255744 [Aaosphaeria arxii CBS 175.79]
MSKLYMLTCLNPHMLLFLSCHPIGREASPPTWRMAITTRVGTTRNSLPRKVVSSTYTHNQTCSTQAQMHWVRATPMLRGNSLHLAIARRWTEAESLLAHPPSAFSAIRLDFSRISQTSGASRRSSTSRSLFSLLTTRDERSIAFVYSKIAATY